MKYLVKGMNCIECVEDLQKHKKDISGLIKVDSYGEDILIEINNNISGEDILNKIKKHLEHMTHNHENLKIYENEFVFLEGLTCANCSAKIEEETKKLKGVEDANFSFSTEKYVLTSLSEIYFICLWIFSLFGFLLINSSYFEKFP